MSSGGERSTGARQNMLPATCRHDTAAARLLLDGDIDKLKLPDYFTLNENAGRNDRLLHAVLCAYVKHHFYEDNHIGWNELDEILFNAITNEIGDDAFCQWLEKLK